MTAIHIIIVIALIFLIAFIYIAISMWRQETRTRGEYMDSMQQDMDEFNGLLADILYVNEQQLKSQTRFSQTISKAAGVELPEEDEGGNEKQAAEDNDLKEEQQREEYDPIIVIDRDGERHTLQADEKPEATDAGEQIITIYPEGETRENHSIEKAELSVVEQEAEPEIQPDTLQEHSELQPEGNGRKAYMVAIKNLYARAKKAVAGKKEQREELTQPGEAQTIEDIYTLITNNQVTEPENNQFQPAKKQSLQYDVGRSGKVYTASELEALIKE